MYILFNGMGTCQKVDICFFIVSKTLDLNFVTVHLKVYKIVLENLVLDIF